jgi:hypothetical protein
VTTEKTALGSPPMQTTSLVLAGTSLAQTGGPPLVIDNVSNTDLKALFQEMYSDRGFLAGVIPERFGPIVSTGATGIAAGIAGLVDGGLGPNSNKIGSIPINTAAAVVFAAGAVFGPKSDIREGCAAAARGFGAPLVYAWSFAKGQHWAAASAAKAAIAPASSVQPTQ